LKVVLVCLCALVGLAACRETFRRKVSFAADELQARIAPQFPLARQSKLAKVVLRNPQVMLAANSRRIGLRTDVEVFPLLGKSFTGVMSFDADVDYKADKGEFYLINSRIGKLDFEEVPDAYQQLAQGMANQILARHLGELAVYRLDADDFEESLAKLVLKEVAIEGGRLVLHLGLI